MCGADERADRVLRWKAYFVGSNGRLGSGLQMPGNGF